MSARAFAGPAAAAVVIVLLLAGCRGRATAASRPYSDVTRAIEKGDLHICSSSRDPDGLANQAVDTRTYQVALDCDPGKGDGETVRLVVDRFDGVDERNAAATHFETQFRPRSDGVVWTWGPFTLFAFGPRDDDVMERLTDALDAAGAQ